MKKAKHKKVEPALGIAAELDAVIEKYRYRDDVTIHVFAEGFNAGGYIGGRSSEHCVELLNDDGVPMLVATWSIIAFAVVPVTKTP